MVNPVLLFIRSPRILYQINRAHLRHNIPIGITASDLSIINGYIVGSRDETKRFMGCAMIQKWIANLIRFLHSKLK